jgi:hypothetical protein
VIARGAFDRLGATLRTRAALGLRPATTPVMVFVPLGVFLGPLGAGALTPRVLDHLDAVVSIALATIGVFVGIAVGTQRGRVRHLVIASTAEGLLTLATVSLAALWLITAWQLPLTLGAWLVAAALGISAAASAATFVGESASPEHHIASRVADLDDVLPILLGTLVLSAAVQDGRDIVSDFLLTVLVGAAAGIGGWLLFDRAEGAERGVFVLGTLALVGGAAAYLGTSPMVSGLAAGYVWARTPGHTDRIAAADLRKFEHPLVVLLLVIAGAGLEPTLVGVWLLAPYILLRTAGKLIGGWMASRLAPGLAPADLGAYLIPPGVLGIGFALNLAQVVPDGAAPLVFAVAAGAVLSELIGVVVTPASSAAP